MSFLFKKARKYRHCNPTIRWMDSTRPNPSRVMISRWKLIRLEHTYSAQQRYFVMTDNQSPIAGEYDVVCTTEDIPLVYKDKVIPKGTTGVVLEVYCTDRRYGYDTELVLSEDDHEVIVLEAHQMIVLKRYDKLTNSYIETGNSLE